MSVLLNASSFCVPLPSPVPPSARPTTPSSPSPVTATWAERSWSLTKLVFYCLTAPEFSDARYIQHSPSVPRRCSKRYCSTGFFLLVSSPIFHICCSTTVNNWYMSSSSKVRLAKSRRERERKSLAKLFLNQSVSHCHSLFHQLRTTLSATQHVDNGGALHMIPLNTHCTVVIHASPALNLWCPL